MSTYAIRQLGMAPTTALLAGITAGFMTFAVSPLSGALTDRIGRKKVIGAAYLALAILIYPAFELLTLFPSVQILLAVVIVLGVAVFGGFGQFIVTWLIGATGSPLAPAGYVTACCIVTLLALRALPETARIKLT